MFETECKCSIPCGKDIWIEVSKVYLIELNFCEQLSLAKMKPDLHTDLTYVLTISDGN